MKTPRAFAWIGIGLLALLVLVRLVDPWPVQAARAFWFDTLQRLSPRAYQPLPVKVVDIDEASLAAHGQWPWPRSKLAALTDRLTGYGAAVVAYDVLFAEPDRLSPLRLLEDGRLEGLLTPGIEPGASSLLDNDATFAAALSRTRAVLGTAETTGLGAVELSKAGLVEIGETPADGLPRLGATTPVLPVLKEAAAGIGGISIVPSLRSDVIRRLPLGWASEGGLLLSLPVEALRLAFEQTTVVLIGSPDLGGYVEALRLADLEIPTMPDGSMWLRYRKDHADLYVSAAELLARDDDPALRAALEGSIVFVGTSAAGLFDIWSTPLGETVPGVAIHAQMTEQILLGDFLYRDAVTGGVEVIALIALGLTVLLVMLRAGPTASITTGAVLGAGWLAASWIGFRQSGLLLDVTFPLVGGFLAFSTLAGWQFISTDREKRLIRRSFSRYVAQSVLSEIESSGHNLALGGEIRPVTIMFCDIRGFTALSEQLSAPDLVRFLNEFFSDLGACIHAEEGTIDKFIGDAIMAFWNAPLESTAHKAQAARAALGMRRALSAFNARKDWPDIAIAIGISSGTACVGNIGSDQRFNYSVVGDAVNVAARVEASCRRIGHDIVLSDTAADGLDTLALLPAGWLDLKGKSLRVGVHILVGDEALRESSLFRSLAARHATLIARLADGEEDVEALVHECRLLAIRIDPALAAFFDAIPTRLEDFR